MAIMRFQEFLLETTNISKFFFFGEERYGGNKRPISIARIEAIYGKKFHGGEIMLLFKIKYLK